METKMIKIPFEVELAKKISNGEVDGKIVTRDGRSVRIICFDAHCEDNIVALVEDSLGIESTFNYLNDGKFFIGDEKECDLFIEIPEYMTFKDGDVISFDECDTVLIVKGTPYKNEIGTIYSDCYAVVVNGYLYVDSNVIINRSRFATEAEKQKLIDELKASKKTEAKEYLKRFFGIEEKKEYEFKPFDKVLVKDDDENSAWSCNLFSGGNEDGTYMCIGGYWDMCIPYNEQTAHLLGTTENYE